MKKQTLKAGVAEKEVMLTVEAVAGILFLGENTIRDYCKKGVLDGKKNQVNGQWRIAQSSVDAYLKGE